MSPKKEKKQELLESIKKEKSWKEKKQELLESMKNVGKVGETLEYWDAWRDAFKKMLIVLVAALIIYCILPEVWMTPAHKRFTSSYKFWIRTLGKQFRRLTGNWG